MTLRVSELAGLVGVTSDTIRYYEKEGLLPLPARSPSGYREFDPELAERLRFIKGAQRFGLRLAEIRELLEIHDKGACPCGHTKVLVERRMAEIDVEMKRLRSLKRDLADLIALDCRESEMADWFCMTEPRKRGGEPDD